MAHPAARRCRLPRDEPDDRLLHVLLHELGGVLLVRSADLAHHANGLGLRILLERLKAIDEVRSVDRIAADADAGRLADAGAGELIDDLVGERAGAADHADRSRLADPPRDDADFRLAGRDQARTVGP